MSRVAILDDYQGAALTSADWTAVQQHGDVVTHRMHINEEADLARALQGFDVVVLMRERTPFRRSLLQELPALGLIVTSGMANAAIDIAAANELGITVCGTGGTLKPTAELTWALIMAVTRGVVREDRALRAGQWQTSLGMDLYGRRLGVVGVGRVGRQVATLGEAFGMDVIAWSPHLTAQRAAEVGAVRVDKPDLFATSDVVTLHVPLNDQTRGLVGAEDLALMRSTAYLVNTSRGPVVDEAALVEALSHGRIAGAALDVYEVEPLPTNHALTTLPNTVLTPHIGFVSESSYRRFFGDIVEDIVAWRDESPIRVMRPPKI